MESFDDLIRRKMSEQPIEFDEKYWLEAERLLDEADRKRRRRKAAFLWFGGSAILLAGFIFLYENQCFSLKNKEAATVLENDKRENTTTDFSQKPTFDSIQNKPSKIKAENSKTTDALIQNSILNTQKTVGSTTQKSGFQKTEKPEVFVSKSKGAGFAKPNFSTKSNSVFSEKSTTENHATAQKTETNFENQRDPLVSEKTIESSIVSKENQSENKIENKTEVSKSEHEKWNDFDLLAVVDFGKLASPSRAILFPDFNTKTKPTRLGTWSVEARLGYASFINNPHGFQLGFSAFRKLGNGFSFSLGLDLAEFHAMTDYSYKESGAKNYRFGSDYLNRVYQVRQEIFVMPNYSISYQSRNSRFSIGAGALIFSAIKVIQNDTKVNYFSGSTTQTKPAFFIKDEQLGRTTPQLFAGYDYQLFKNIKLGLRAEVNLGGLHSIRIGYLDDVESIPRLEFHVAYTIFKSKK